MDGNGMRLSAAVLAAVVAGPVFLTAWYAAELYLRLPAPILVDPAEIMRFVLILIPSLLLGLLLAIVPVLIVTLVMSACAERSEAARSGPAWAAAGAFAGAGIAVHFGLTGTAIFALVATSAICGWLARRSVEV